MMQQMLPRPPLGLVLEPLAWKIVLLVYILEISSYSGPIVVLKPSLFTWPDVKLTVRTPGYMLVKLAPLRETCCPDAIPMNAARASTGT